jgi:DNA-binding transcriptional ArsR family regulator
MRKGATVGISHKLTQGQIASIPLLLGQLGSNTRVAEALGIDESTVRHHLRALNGEQWDRIREMQTDLAARQSVDIMFQALGLLPDKLREANVRDLLGAYKLLREGAVSLGGLGTRGQDQNTDLERFAQEAELMRLRDLVSKAKETGSVDVLEAV